MLYLIKRGPKPDYHRAPYHPVIICDRKPVALAAAGDSPDGACMWSHEPQGEYSGWFLLRWMGCEIVFRGVITGQPLVDGTRTGFYHERDAEPWTLLAGATWWSDRKMPGWLADRGVRYPEDDFTQQRILDQIANIKGPDGYWGPLAISVSGFGRPIPDHWQKGARNGDAESGGPAATRAE